MKLFKFLDTPIEGPKFHNFDVPIAFSNENKLNCGTGKRVK